jgi:hypothetical protein
MVVKMIEIQAAIAVDAMAEVCAVPLYFLHERLLLFHFGAGLTQYSPRRFMLRV